MTEDDLKKYLDETVTIRLRADAPDAETIGRVHRGRLMTGFEPGQYNLIGTAPIVSAPPFFRAEEVDRLEG